MKKFLCDKMCAELGRWLRAAGYDTSIIEDPLKDEQVFQKALEEKRLLLTHDKHFKEMDPEEKQVIYLKNESLEAWVLQLKKQGIDWLYRPFSRCLKCNSLLTKANPSEDVPDEVRKNTTDFWLCSHCNQLFWLGSHTDRMRERLRAWRDQE